MNESAPERGMQRARSVLSSIETTPVGADAVARIAAKAAHSQAIATVELAAAEQARVLLGVLDASATHMTGAAVLPLTSAERRQVEQQLRLMLGFPPDINEAVRMEDRARIAAEIARQEAEAAK